MIIKQVVLLFFACVVVSFVSFFFKCLLYNWPLVCWVSTSINKELNLVTIIF
jgi:hypothetical protein